jgi:ankyrin repeat protein
VYAVAACAGDTPLLYIAREGHYKYPPAEIPALLIQSGANMEAKDSAGRTALQVGHMG